MSKCAWQLDDYVDRFDPHCRLQVLTVFSLNFKNVLRTCTSVTIISSSSINDGSLYKTAVSLVYKLIFLYL